MGNLTSIIFRLVREESQCVTPGSGWGEWKLAPVASSSQDLCSRPLTDLLNHNTSTFTRLVITDTLSFLSRKHSFLLDLQKINEHVVGGRVTHSGRKWTGGMVAEQTAEIKGGEVFA